MDYKVIFQVIANQYTLDLNGIHGISHWARVMDIGMRIASTNGAKLEVVQLFALFHDSKRLNEHNDPEHGVRGSNFAESLLGSLVHLSREDFLLLQTACMYHTNGLVHGNITVQTCWDSDRLDLGRVDVVPNPIYLCTQSAKKQEMIDWAYKNSVDLTFPSNVAKYFSLF